MRAWRVHDVGEPDRVIRVDEIPAPDAGALAGLRMSLGGWVPAGFPGAAPDPHEDWAVIDVAMAALSLPDVTMARGTYPVPVPRPYTSGQEGVGVVTDAAPRHRHLVGKRVAACMIQPFGSLAGTAVGVDVIVDPVQGDGADDLRRALRAGGRHVLCGHAGGLGPIDPRFYLRNHTLVRVTLGGYPPDEIRRMHEEAQAALDGMVASGEHRSTPTRVIAFDEVPAALADIAARRSAGRIVVDVRS